MDESGAKSVEPLSKAFRLRWALRLVPLSTKVVGGGGRQMTENLEFGRLAGGIRTEAGFSEKV